MLEREIHCHVSLSDVNHSIFNYKASGFEVE